MTTIASHIVRRLREHGVDTGFGIVGDFALRLFGALDAEGLPVLVTADEQGAGFAADAYARMRGLGAVFATYGVGGLKLANAVAGAWAENVPLLVVSGSPGIGERADDPLLHHKVKSFSTQADVFRDLTAAGKVLDNPQTAAADIDRVIATILSQQRPGYLEVPRDMVGADIADIAGPLQVPMPKVDDARLRAAVGDVMNRLRLADTAVALAGVILARRHLGDSLVALAEHAGMPVATSALSRGAFPERHPLALGVYQGAVSPERVTRRVEDADVILNLGVLPTDLIMGGFTASLDPQRLIECTDTDVTVGLRTYRDVPLWAFLPALAEEAVKGRLNVETHAAQVIPAFVPAPDTPATVDRVIAALATRMDDRHGLIPDPGEALFSSVDLSAPAWSMSSAYYATMGYAVPAALGAGVADRSRRPVVIVGDGAFSMTGLEAGWCAFHGIAPIIVILDNSGYGTQRPMLDGPFNDIQPMRSELLADVFGTGRGWLATTEEEVDSVLGEAFAFDGLAIVRVVVPKGRPSAALTRLTEALRKRV